MSVSMTWRQAYWKTCLLAVESPSKRSRDRPGAGSPKNPCERKTDKGQGHDGAICQEVIRTK